MANTRLSMWLKVTEGIANPFIGTALGSACVFFMKKQLSRTLQRALTGFAGGVMVYVIDMEPAYPRDEPMRRPRQTGVSARLYRFPARYPVSAFAR